MFNISKPKAGTKLVRPSITFVSLLLFSMSIQAQNASVSLETRILNIPILEVDNGVETQYAEIDLLGSEDFSSFSLAGGDYIDAPTSINLTNINGEYDGEAKVFAAGTNIGLTAAQSCAIDSFNPSSNTTTISVVSSSVEIIQDSFFNGTCELTGELSNNALSGSFQCSNFNNGQWSASQLEIINENLLVAVISMEGEDCDYDLHLIGYKE
jgi:hypothetical protein